MCTIFQSIIKGIVSSLVLWVLEISNSCENFLETFLQNSSKILIDSSKLILNLYKNEEVIF